MFRRQIVIRALNYIKKNDLFKPFNSNKFHSTLLSKLPIMILNRKLIDLNAIITNKYSKFIEKLVEKTETEPEAEIINRYTALFDDCDIDGWWTRKHMSDLSGMDMIPHPLICQAALRACRRLNDYALGIRFMEMVRFKCGNNKDTYKWINDQMQVVYAELGMESPEELCYDVPELFLDNTYNPMYPSPSSTPPKKVMKEVPIATKPPPYCKKDASELENIDISKKPPPQCMVPPTGKGEEEECETEVETPKKPPKE